MIICLLTAGCASMRTQVDRENHLGGFLRQGEYSQAAAKIEDFKTNKDYMKKDRVLYYLDKGAVLHYLKKYNESNEVLEQADVAMEELFTRSISAAAASLFLNDNVIPYYGEVYENIYVNVLKAINYMQLDNFQDAYVEIKRVNDKLRELEVKYARLVDEFNKADTTEIKIEKKTSTFYDDALAHYLSHLVFRAAGEWDNSRISFHKLRSAWRIQPTVYDYPLPQHVQNDSLTYDNSLNIIAFTGTAPYKYAIGGKITTYEDYIHLSDVSGYKKNLVLAFPGMKQGYHFKFAFPELRLQPSEIANIEVYIDGSSAGYLELLEDMGQVAKFSFETQKNIIYFKTLVRTVAKGLASVKAKEKLRKKAGAEDNFLLSAILNFGVDAAVDATENPDLRYWRTMPRYCYANEFQIPSGTHNIEIRYLGTHGKLIHTDSYTDFPATAGLNLLESICLK